MSVIRLTKEFTFEAAHMLEGYDGLCREIHGHSYKLFVTVKGEPQCNECSPKLGMVMDFGDLKAIVAREIIDRLDHSFVLRDTEDNRALAECFQNRFDNVVMVPYQPTCENMLSDFALRLLEALPDEVELYSLRLHETASSYAEWYAEDNL